MTKITRSTLKEFGSSGPNGDFGKFGSLAEGDPTFTKDPATIQSLARFLTGLGDAVVAGAVPALEDINSLFLLLFQQMCYVLQQGIPEYDAGTTYYIGGYVQDSGIIYVSLQDANVGNTPASSPTYWAVQQFLTTAAQTIDGVKTFSSFPLTPSSAPTTDYQASNKKYVDDKVAGIGRLGAWDSKSASTVYQAATDGFLVGSVHTDDNNYFEVRTDSSSTPTTVRMAVGNAGSTTTDVRVGFCCPIKKNDYYRIIAQGSGDQSTLEYCYFMPLGT